MRIPGKTYTEWLLEAAAGLHGVSRFEVMSRMGKNSCQRSTTYLVSTGQIVRHVSHKGRSKAVRYFRTAGQLAAWLAVIEAERILGRQPVTLPSATPPPLPKPALPAVYQVSGLYAVAGELTHCAGTMPIDRPQPRRISPAADAAPYMPRADSRQAERLPSRQGDWLVYPGGRREHAPLPQVARRTEPARI